MFYMYVRFIVLYYYFSRQLQYDNTAPIVPRPHSNTISSGQYTTILEGNRVMSGLNRNQAQDFGNLEDQEWYWGNVSK